MRFYKKLYWQVLIGVCLGTGLGYLYPSVGVELKPVADVFIKMIKMIIAPIIFCTVVTGMAGMADMRKMGKLGGLSLFYFEAVTTLALGVGIAVINVFPLGVGMHVDVGSLDVSGVAKFTSQKAPTMVELLTNIVPSSFVGAFSGGETLQVLFVSIVFGFALQRLGGKENPVYRGVESVSEIFFKIVNQLMHFAPLGAGTAMAYTVAKFGLGTLLPLLKLVGLFWLSASLFVVVVLGGILAYYRISLWRLIRYIREELFIVLGTCSSEAVMPSVIRKMQEMGVKKETAGFVVPAGYAFNLDGTTIYFGLATIFLAQATDTYLGWGEQLSLFLVLLVTSKGANAIYGSAFIILGSTLASLGTIPIESIALILGIDRFMAEGRVVVNLIGNCVATLAIASQTGDLDREMLQSV